MSSIKNSISGTIVTLRIITTFPRKSMHAQLQGLNLVVLSPSFPLTEQPNNKLSAIEKNLRGYRNNLQKENATTSVAVESQFSLRANDPLGKKRLPYYRNKGQLIGPTEIRR